MNLRSGKVTIPDITNLNTKRKRTQMDEIEESKNSESDSSEY